jgi:cyclophilin family peptidyl-prolyl cis-trans isomerase
MARHHHRPVALVMLLLLPLFATVSVTAETETPLWRSVGLDPEAWTDRPEAEDSPMMASYTGNAVIEMNVSYVEAHFSQRQEGTVIIELFEQWAPITTTNMIQHVESGLYDGIFFHRVIDDFVTQSGDPTCRELGAYPATSPQCGSGGTGETIPLEHNENLSHVDGAIGMARSTEPDSADSQWYIAETEAHGLDPENRDDEGYATFGIVRDGMAHIRAIALTPTTDDLTGLEEIQNPASSAGRPVYQAQILSMRMIGVADPDGSIRNPVVEAKAESTFLQDMVLVVGLPLFLMMVGAGAVYAVYTGREDREASNLVAEGTGVVEGELVMDGEMVADIKPSAGEPEGQAPHDAPEERTI